ncbi:hypothetical protein [Paenibacillus sp. MMS20-IR301]|uniref:hypothetical protein n=1 Tax=Paenibacillus sp. MMS20-IR301 TaxID=2895946 RepID=UPI0028EB8CF7|nr:hypothetical protein [Paenibacillus sp. MMS20-IR301]WNS46175.1 hypothetical protein LOS79_13175 [Paenibacillus sp. MMS20-IR301]
MLAEAQIGRWIHQLRGQRKMWIITAGVLLLLAIGSLIVLRLNGSGEQEVFSGLPHSYTYLEAESSGKIHLHMMAVNPEDVVLRRAGLPLRQIAAYGINGGFFYGEDLLSIAIMDDQPVNGAPHGYGSGWFNAKYARGTLVWDGAAEAFSVQVAAAGGDLAVSDRGNYWAQGGISMNLQHEELWAAAAAAEHLPYEGEQRLRSGLVYDQAGKLWLLVTNTLCTAAEFRAAVLETVPGEGREGIFLDGDGSSQMNAEEAVLTGDSRPVVQMIAVAGGK